jgi:hypothetical protein
MTSCRVHYLAQTVYIHVDFGSQLGLWTRLQREAGHHQETKIKTELTKQEAVHLQKKEQTGQFSSAGQTVHRGSYSLPGKKIAFGSVRKNWQVSLTYSRTVSSKE